MLRDEALNMARVLLDKRGLWEWRIAATDETMTDKQVFGYMVGPGRVGGTGFELPVVPIEQVIVVAARCFRPLQLILLSGPVVDQTSIVGVREMVLHEIAHALTTGSHDEAWEAVAKSIGCTGKPQIDLEYYAEPKTGEEASA